jgi:hypothetical protein
MLFCTSRAKSPRIVPGAAFTGSVAPARARNASMARVALGHEGHERAAGDELDERAEERPLTVLGVVRLGGVAVERAQLGCDEPQPLALQAGDHLADQATGDAIGLDEDESAFGHGAAAYGVAAAAGRVRWAAH